MLITIPLCYAQPFRLQLLQTNGGRKLQMIQSWRLTKSNFLQFMQRKNISFLSRVEIETHNDLGYFMLELNSSIFIRYRY